MPHLLTAAAPGAGRKPPVGDAVVKLKVGFILAKSFTLSAFSLFVDTLRLASDERDRSGRVLADWEVLGSTRLLIRSSCGVQVAPTCDFVSPTRFDVLVVCGGLLSVERPVDEETLRYLKEAARARVPLIGLCTGTFILAEAGLLRQHQTCVSWLHHDEFRQRFPDHQVRSDRLYNFDGQRGSCAGGSSSADMAAFLVRAKISRKAELNALEVLQIDRARKPTDTQSRKPLEDTLDTSTADPRIRAALITMEQNLADPRSIEDIAESIGMSRRQMERIFQISLAMSPAQAYTLMRLKKAHALMTQSQAALIDIALDVGFRSAAHFARAFKRIYGIAPSRLRQTRPPSA